MPKPDMEEYKEYVTARLGKLSHLLVKYAQGDFSESIEIPEEEDEFTELLVEISLMVDDIKEMVKKEAGKTTRLATGVSEMIEAIMKVAGGDYSVQLELSDQNDELDSLAVGLNMMIDDIKTSEQEMRIKDNAIASSINAIAITDLEGNLTYLERIEKEAIEFIVSGGVLYPTGKLEEGDKPKRRSTRPLPGTPIFKSASSGTNGREKPKDPRSI